ncbi:MAG: hypothetical protein ABSF53_16105 [Terracidiphilus sp.]
MRSKLQEVQRDQKLEASEVEHDEDHLSQASDPDEKKHFTEEIERHKANVAALKIEEGNRATTLKQMEQRLQNEQDSLANIEKELNVIIARPSP